MYSKSNIRKLRTTEINRLVAILQVAVEAAGAARYHWLSQSAPCLIAWYWLWISISKPHFSPHTVSLSLCRSAQESNDSRWPALRPQIALLVVEHLVTHFTESIHHRVQYFVLVHATFLKDRFPFMNRRRKGENCGRRKGCEAVLDRCSLTESGVHSPFRTRTKPDRSTNSGS